MSSECMKRREDEEGNMYEEFLSGWKKFQLKSNVAKEFGNIWYKYKHKFSV